jgi:RHS repeat-associated protein
MTNAAKHFDPQIGIDIHMYELVPGTPPVPLPTAHISMVLDPFDYLPFIGATVQVAGVKRATAGTGGLSVHIPLALWVPFLRAPGGPQFDDELFMGSKTVLADDSPFSRLGMPVLDCSVVGMVPPFRLKKPSKPHLSMTLPTSINLAIPDSVFVGGPPTISLMGIASKLGLAALGKGFKALRRTKGFQRAEEAFKKARQKLFKNMEPGFLKCKVLRAEPVDIRDGSVAVFHEDFFIPGRLPLTWTRVYSSNSSHDGICGYGWQTPADFRLEIEPDGMVLFFEESGAAVFPHLPEAAGTAHAVTEFVDGAQLSWIRNGGADELHVVTKDDLRYVFRKPASNVAPLHQALHLQIEKIEDLCGNHWRFERADGDLTRIVESGIDELPGRFIEVHQAAGKIHQLSLHDPFTGLNHPLATYRYQNQDLVAALDALDAARTFDYDRHRLVRHADRLGLSFYYTYDSEWRVVHAWGDQGLHNFRFAYNPALRETEVTDSLGHTSLIKFDEDNLPLCEIDPLGGVTIFEYDYVGRTTAIVDPMGSRTEFSYDERGNLLKFLPADGNATVMIFDDANHMTKVVDPLGQHWRRVWDNRGLLLEQSSPMGACSRFEYDAYGQLQVFTNPRGATTTLRYDRHGNPSQMTDALGHSSYFENHVLGYLRRRTDSVSAVVEYRHDAKGRLLQTLQANGSNLYYEYDAEDQLVGYTGPDGARTRLEYTGIGRLAKRVKANGRVVQYVYDTEEQLIGLINERQESYGLKRDALGRIVEEVDYWKQMRKYRYDAAGRLLSASDPLGKNVSYVTDRMGRIVKKILPDPGNPGRRIQEEFSYDKTGALTEMRNPHRHILRKFDADGRLTEELQDGFQIENRYDEVGNRLSRKTSAGNLLVFTFDLRDQLASVVINQESPILIERDALGRIVKEQLSEHVQRQRAYDKAGHWCAQTVLRDQAPLFSVKYDYDLAGNQTRRNDSEYGNDLYRYDPLGNILRHTDPAGRITDFINDPAGDRLRTQIRAAEMKQVAGAEGMAEAVWSREGSYEGVRYVFDRAGNLVQRGAKPPASGNVPAQEHDVQLRWDANQRLIETSGAGQVIRYGYDPLGRRVFKRNSQQTTWFFWDGDMLLGEVQQVNDGKNAADIWSASNVADFIAVRRRLTALAALHSQVREYVYYPGTFVPLALIDRQARKTRLPIQKKKEAPRSAEMQSKADAAASMVIPPALAISAAPVNGPAGTGGLGDMGGLGGGIRLGQLGEVPPVGTEANRSPMLSGLGTGMQLGGASDALQRGPAPTIPASAFPSNTGSENAEPDTFDSGIFHYHNDPNGCPLRLTTASGQVVWSASYAVWGRVRDLHAHAVDNPIRFQGQYHDTETGLHYNRHRYYDPEIGQFVGQDPIGLAGGENPYQYAPNPMTWIDPLGLARGKKDKVYVYRQLNAEDRARFDSGSSLKPKGSGGSIAEHVAGADTGHISASLTEDAAKRFESGNGLVKIDVEAAIAGDAKYIDHNNVLQGAKQSKNLTVLRDARRAEEVLFKGEIPHEAMTLCRK